jgi:transcription initiation factor IIE alpha subunit
MPKFYEMVEVEAEVWVDVNEFIDSCSDKEIQKIITRLVEDGLIKKSDVKNPRDNVLDEIWKGKVEKLFNNRLQLSNEEIEIIEKIANRL